MAVEQQGLLCFEDIWTICERQSGAFGLGDEGLKARCRQIIDWINARGPYGEYRLSLMAGQIRKLLVNRLRVARDRATYSGIAQEAITHPIFVIGFGRSGTSFLHSLMAQDPEVLSPRSWHMQTPSPPPGAGPVCRGRIDYAERAVQHWIDLCPAQLTFHPYADEGAFQLMEDEEFFALDFRNFYTNHWYHVPDLELVEPDLGDPVAGFRFHREMLQHFQWNTGLSRWVCKAPTAQNQLAALFEAYPDALCIWSHRPISEVFSSLVAITSGIYETINGKPRNWDKEARNLATQVKDGFDRMMADAMIDDERIMHVRFQDLTADPAGLIKKIYQRRGWEFSPAFAANIESWLADPDNRVDRYGRYPYVYEPFGLNRDWIKTLFADYTARFGLVEKA